MQDKTINNALLALAKQGGAQGKLADVLLELRGVEWSGIVQDRPMKRGGTKEIIIQSLRSGAMTSWQLGGVLRQQRPDVGQRAAANRAYQSLRRLNDQKLVRRDGLLWQLT